MDEDLAGQQFRVVGVVDEEFFDGGKGLGRSVACEERRTPVGG